MKQKKKTRFLTVCFLILLMATSLLGCTSDNSSCNNPSEESSSESSTSSDATVETGEFSLPIVEETVTLTMWSSMDSNLTTIVDDYNETAFFQRLEEETNVHIEFNTPAVGNEATAYNLMIASNELPDMIRHIPAVQYPGGFDAAIDDGYFLDLTDLLPQYAPHYLETLKTRDSTYQKAAVTASGRYATVNQINKPQGPWAGLYVRQDWLDRLNLETPETYADWEVMLTGFKEEMGATAPLLLYKTGYDSTSQALNSGFGVNTSFYQEGGTVKYGPAEEGWREYVSTMHDWYEKGLIDPDFMSTNWETGFLPDTAMVTTGKTGAFVGMYTNVSMWENSNQDPNAQYTPVPQIRKNEGDSFDFLSTAMGSGTGMAISAKSENAEICLRWLDYFFTDEGFIDINYGIEGETFEYVDGEPRYTTFITENEDLSLGQAMAFYTLPAGWPSRQDWSRETSGMTEEDLISFDIWGAGTGDKFLPSVSVLGMNTEDNTEYSRIMADIQSIVDEKTAQFISGAASLDNYDDYLQQLEQMGIQDAINLVQKAYDAFITRDVE